LFFEDHFLLAGERTVLTGVSLTCFLFSYLIVLSLEIWRLFFRLPVRQWLVLSGMSAGLLAHTIFLANQFVGQSSDRLLSNWFQWIVFGAWGLAVACTYLMVRNPAGNIGLFILPLVLVMIGVATLVRGYQPFASGSSVSLWARIHTVSLLLSTMFILQGFAFALMYLVHSYRLKRRSKTPGILRLPALEFLQSINRLNLIASAIALGVGMLSGIFLNLSRDDQVSWFSGGVLFSLALFLWALIAALLESRSQSSLGGRRGAYLSIASFVILVVVFLLLLITSHGQSVGKTNPKPVSAVENSGKGEP
jgi:hypothetical protein